MLFAASVAVVLANLLAFVVYGFDKRQAVNDAWRVSEGTLILLAILGGIGAWMGCEVFRHKTRKQPFRTYLTIAVILHAVILFSVFAFSPGGA